jgi:hypothetical protein
MPHIEMAVRHIEMVMIVTQQKNINAIHPGGSLIKFFLPHPKHNFLYHISMT